MDWQKFLNQLNAEYKDLGEENPDMEFYMWDGHKLEVTDVYNEDGILCIDFRRAQINE